MRSAIALVVLLVLPGLAGADEPPKPTAPPATPSPAPAVTPAPAPTPEQAADAVLAAVKALDDAALSVLAAKDAADPWLVADELIRRGEFGAAEAFAKAAPRVDVARLPAYVESRRGKPDDAAARRSVVESSAALAAKNARGALEALGAADAAPAADVVGIRRAFGRGVALRLLNRIDESAAAFLVAAEAAARIGWPARASRALDESGMSAVRRSDFHGALSAWERRLAICEARGDRRGEADTLGNIGLVHDSLGNYPKALESFERTLKLKDDLGDRTGAARTLGNIGSVHYSLGNYPKALDYGARALQMAEDLGDRAGAAATLATIGNTHYAMGEYPKAFEQYERALRMMKDMGDRTGAAVTIGNIGAVHFSLGNGPRALEHYERALGLMEDLGDRAGAASMIGNIGNVYSQLGDHPKALEYHERALEMKEDLGDRAGAALTIGNIGNVHEALGNGARALECYERSLRIQEGIGDRQGAARTLGSLGHVHCSLGDFARAVQALDRAVRAAEKLGANDLLVYALRGLALVRLKAGDVGRAISDAHRAVSLLKSLVGGLGEEQSATSRGGYAGLFSTGLAAAARAHDASEAVFFLESGRAGSLLESLDARDSLRRAAIPEELRLAEAAARAGEARALVAYTKAHDSGDLAAIRAHDEELNAARANVQEIVERIQRNAKKQAHLWYPVATPIEDIQGFLAPGETLVLYGLAEKDADAHALVLTRGAVRIVHLGKSSEIVTACEALDLSDRDADPSPALDRLRALLVGPLGLAEETKRFLVSPDGPLSYVPFAALVPDLVVAYESSGSTYGVLRDEKEKHGEQVLALADADYTARFDPIALDVYAPLAAASPTRGGRLAPLPGTREEAMAVADVRLLGKDASESGLRAALGRKKDRWHAVHFACHGLVNPERPTLSSLALTPDAENDGFLTALEVLRVEIPSDLVVLSACETGKGKIVGGEGIVGLMRAFMYAGSPRVICSLWKVDDDATRALMVKFYELWNPKDGKPGLPTAEALKKAQEFVKSREKWKHPYYWAAWVLWGLPE